MATERIGQGATKQQARQYASLNDESRQAESGRVVQKPIPVPSVAIAEERGHVAKPEQAIPDMLGAMDEDIHQGVFT
jgi:hypothetical protein